MRRRLIVDRRRWPVEKVVPEQSVASLGRLDVGLYRHCGQRRRWWCWLRRLGRLRRDRRKSRQRETLELTEHVVVEALVGGGLREEARARRVLTQARVYRLDPALQLARTVYRLYRETLADAVFPGKYLKRKIT